jgi:hypothetical protein
MGLSAPGRWAGAFIFVGDHYPAKSDDTAVMGSWIKAPRKGPNKLIPNALSILF